ncbi:MAG: hypothetical protein N2645_03460 [Clostridia bacterium]|nr:hypothetical protein [Clostridia bacterium]
MSFPNIPDIHPEIDIEREDVCNLLLLSIALEEISLSELIDAEVEKIKFAIGDNPDTTNKEILEINRSVHRIMMDVIKLEMLLQFKLEEVLDRVCSSTTCSTSSSTSTTTTSTTTTTFTTTNTSTSTTSTTFSTTSSTTITTSSTTFSTTSSTTSTTTSTTFSTTTSTTTSTTSSTTRTATSTKSSTTSSTTTSTKTSTTTHTTTKTTSSTTRTASTTKTTSTTTKTTSTMTKTTSTMTKTTSTTTKTTSTTTRTTSTMTKTTTTRTATKTTTSATSFTTTTTRKKCHCSLKGRGVGCISNCCDRFFAGTAVLQADICTLRCEKNDCVLCYSVQKGDILETFTAFPNSLKIKCEKTKDGILMTVKGLGEVKRKERGREDITKTGSFELKLIDRDKSNKISAFQMIITVCDNPFLDHHSGKVTVKASNLAIKYSC